MGEIRTLSQLLDRLRHDERVTKADVAQKQQNNAAHNQAREERHFCIELAGHTIGIESMYSDVHSMCETYLSDADPEIRIRINDEDLKYEYMEAKKEKATQSAGCLETLAAYRKISTALLDYDVFLMHGAVIAEGQDAYLFTAKSGTGKTTHIRKWLDQIENSYVVNGDKPLIRITDTQAIACGTPWCGKEKMQTNCMVPLKAIVLMERGENNEIKEITFGDAFTFLLQQTYQPNGSEYMKKTLKLLSQLKSRVRFYRFIFNNMKEDAFNVAYETLTGEER